MERAFTAQMGKNGDPTFSAAKAGYAFPAIAGSKLMRNADVAADIQKRLEDEIQNDLAPLAVWRVRKVLLDDDQKGSVHVAGAKLVLDYALKRITGNQRELAEMTSAEIDELLTLSRRRLKTIEHAPIAQAAPNIFE